MVKPGPADMQILFTVYITRIRTEEEFSSGGRVEDVRRRQAEHFHDAGELLDLVLAGEQRVAGVQLDDDAAQTPHVDRRRVRQAEDHFGRSVEARLDVRVHCRTRAHTVAGLAYRARQLYKNISMLFLFLVKDGKLSTGVNETFNASCYG